MSKQFKHRLTKQQRKQHKQARQLRQLSRGKAWQAVGDQADKKGVIL